MPFLAFLSLELSIPSNDASLFRIVISYKWWCVLICERKNIILRSIYILCRKPTPLLMQTVLPARLSPLIVWRPDKRESQAETTEKGTTTETHSTSQSWHVFMEGIFNPESAMPTRICWIVCGINICVSLKAHWFQMTKLRAICLWSEASRYSE